MSQKEKESFIFECIKSNHKDELIDLIHSGVNLEVKNKDRETPLQVAAALNSQDIVKILIEAGAKIESPRLISQLAESVTSEISEFPVEVLEILVEAGLDINYPGEDGDTLLMEATMENNLPLVKKLVELGADPNRINKYGDFALSSTRNKADIYKYLYPITDPVLRQRISWKFD
jgi:ankyrin repeat protein